MCENGFLGIKMPVPGLQSVILAIGAIIVFGVIIVS